MSGPSAGESSPSLRRTLGTTDLTLLVVGNVIGSGIFIVPSAVLREAGSVPMAMAVWVVGGVLSLFGALSYAELGAMDRGSGGLYSYVRDAFGRFPAFLLGWTFFFGIGGGTVAALAVAITSYLGQFVVLAPVAQKGMAVALIAAMAAIAFPGIRRSATVQNWGTLVKFGALLVMSVILLAGGQGGAPLPAADHAGPGALLSAAGVAMLSMPPLALCSKPTA